eukprot:TRINITY_DN18847_c0_g2_i1.p1 TRINITY_DN18847_c0_g2~~TRINITY_DN18847_c0_g2_i1.p1  ORF type:complete len:2313 (+),score=764.41 TRINITY_DN18847_c0_g2_i1:628-6939(+)
MPASSCGELVVSCRWRWSVPHDEAAPHPPPGQIRLLRPDGSAESLFHSPTDALSPVERRLNPGAAEGDELQFECYVGPPPGKMHIEAFGVGAVTDRDPQRRLVRRLCLYEAKRSLTFSVVGLTHGDYNTVRGSCGVLAARSRTRCRLILLVDSKWYRLGVLCVILTNTAALAAQTWDPSKEASQWTSAPGMIDVHCTFLFAVELVLATLAKGCVLHPDAHYRDPWSAVDAVIVAAGLSELVYGGADLTVLRIVRVVRPLRAVARVRGLTVAFETIITSVPRVLDALVVLVFLVWFFSILGVQVWAGAMHRRCFAFSDPCSGASACSGRVTPVMNDTRSCGTSTDIGRQCGADANGLNASYHQLCLVGDKEGVRRYFNFDNVGHASLLIFKGITLSRWSDDLDVVQDNSGWVAWLFYFTVTLLGALFCTNLVLAIIVTGVGKVGSVRTEPPPLRPLQQDAGRPFAVAPFAAAVLHGPLSFALPHADVTDTRVHPAPAMPLRGDADSDDDADSQMAAENPGKARTAAEMALTSDVVTALYQSSESAGRQKLAEEAVAVALEDIRNGRKLKREAAKWALDEVADLIERTVNSIVRTLEIRRVMRHGTRKGGVAKVRSVALRLLTSQVTQAVVFLVTLLNCAVLAADHYRIDPATADHLDTVNSACSLFFVVEVVLKTASFGPRLYLTDPYNAADCALALVSVLEGAVGGSQGSALSVFRVLRMFRAFRAIRVVATFGGLRRMLSALAGSLSSLVSLALLFVIVMFMFGVLGVQLFYTSSGGGRIPGERASFSTLGDAMLTSLVITTGDGWASVTAGLVREHGASPILYALAIVVIGNYVVVNLFAAVLIEQFVTHNPCGSDDADEMLRLQDMIETQLLDSDSIPTVQELLGLWRPVGDPGARTARSREPFASPAAADRDTGAMEALQRPAASPVTQSSGTSQPLEGVVLAADSPSEDLDTLPATSYPAASTVTDSVCAPLPPQQEPTEDATSDATEEVTRLTAGQMLVAQMRLTRSRARQRTFRGQNVLVLKLSDRVEDDDAQGRARNTQPAEEADGVPVILADLQETSCCCLRPTSVVRSAIHDMVTRKGFETLIMVLIVVNCVCIGVDHPRLRDRHPSVGAMLDGTDVAFAALFCVELSLKIAAHGCWGTDTAYLSDAANRIDFVVVLSSLAGLVRANESPFPFREFRSLRVFRLVLLSKDCRLTFMAIVKALPQIMNALGIIVVIWLVYAIVGVQLFKGRYFTCSDPNVTAVSQCVGVFTASVAGAFGPYQQQQKRVLSNAARFDHVGEALWSILIVAMGEGWGDLMYTAIDSTGEDEISHTTRASAGRASVYFVTMVIVAQFFLVNLFVGVLIDQFITVRGFETGAVLLTSEQMRWVHAQRALLKVRLDGVVTAPKSSLRRAAYDTVFSAWFDPAVAALIFVSSVSMSTQHHGMGRGHQQSLQYINLVLVVLFSGEAVLRIVASGPTRYLANGWNRFDLLTVGVSWFGVVVSDSYSVLRLFRVGRLLRAAKHLRNIGAMFDTLIGSMPAVLNIAAVLASVFFVFSAFGVALFGRVARSAHLTEFTNFDNMPYAFVTLWQVATRNRWAGLAESCSVTEEPGCNPSLNNCGTRYARIYFALFIVFGSLITLNLLVCVVLEHFGEVTEGMENTKKIRVFNVFRSRWLNQDAEARKLMHVRDFVATARTLPHPLFTPQRPTDKLECVACGCKCSTFMHTLRQLAMLHIPVSRALEVKYEHAMSSLAMRVFDITPEGAVATSAALGRSMPVPYLADEFSIHHWYAASRIVAALQGSVRRSKHLHAVAAQKRMERRLRSVTRMRDEQALYARSLEDLIRSRVRSPTLAASVRSPRTAPALASAWSPAAHTSPQRMPQSGPRSPGGLPESLGTPKQCSSTNEPPHAGSFDTLASSSTSSGSDPPPSFDPGTSVPERRDRPLSITSSTSSDIVSLRIPDAALSPVHASDEEPVYWLRGPEDSDVATAAHPPSLRRQSPPPRPQWRSASTGQAAPAAPRQVRSMSAPYTAAHPMLAPAPRLPPSGVAKRQLGHSTFSDGSESTQATPARPGVVLLSESVGSPLTAADHVQLPPPPRRPSVRSGFVPGAAAG